jgi:hypothetical protein
MTVVIAAHTPTCMHPISSIDFRILVTCINIKFNADLLKQSAVS